MSGDRGDRGALALLLHSHMPYVEGLGTWPFGEEWLWEATATVYLPLLKLLEGRPVTVGLTPVLCDQFEAMAGEPGDRFVSFLRDIRAPVHAEDARGLEEGGEHELAEEVRRAAGDYAGAEREFLEIGRDLIGAFRGLAEGPTELWTSCATHAVLPLLATEPGRRLQVSAGTAAHERRFGHWNGGFWLPECAYEPELELVLTAQGASCFCVDQTDALGLGSLDQLSPVSPTGGVVAVPIDWELISLIWDPVGGYPVHPGYRNYHGRTVHDLKPWNNGGEPYRHEEALALAGEHAAQFVSRVLGRLDAHRAERGRPGLACCALDTELLGHWWYEGPAWLESVFHEAERQGLELVTLPAAPDRFEAVERPLAASSWGKPKDLSTWDSPRVAELAFAARRAELRTVNAAAAARPPEHPALARAARELLAVQSSDWAFLTTWELAADYPERRMRAHLDAHDAALAAVEDSSPLPEPSLRNLAPQLDLSPLLAP